MLKNKTILAILMLLCTNVFAQVKQPANSDSNFVFYKLIKGKFNAVNVDMLGNIYVVTETNQLKKLNSNGDSLGSFNDVKKFGTVSSIDVSNPLKVLLFYKNYGNVVFLDRQLVFRNSFNVKQQNLFKVKIIANAYDNNNWIYDEQDFKIKKIKDNGATITETTDLRQVFDAAPIPTKIIDDKSSLYLYDAQKGLFVFDYYGSLKQKIPLRGWSSIAIANNTVLGISGDVLNNYDIKTLLTKTYKLPAFFSGYKDIIALNGKIYLLKNTGVEIYTIQ